MDHLKSSSTLLESPLLVNEFTGFGGSSSIWTCCICILRERTLAFYQPIVTEGSGMLATAGVQVRALCKGGHKVIDYLEPGGSAERNASLHIGYSVYLLYWYMRTNTDA